MKREVVRKLLLAVSGFGRNHETSEIVIFSTSFG
jgi:hypothetical protein